MKKGGRHMPASALSAIRVIDGAKLREKRKLLDGSPSLREFAKQVGISYVTLGRIEQGKANASPKMIGRLAKALNCEQQTITRIVTPSLEGDLLTEIQDLKRRVEALEAGRT